MHHLTQAAYASLDEIWSSIHEQSLVHTEPAYIAGLWRMAGHMCTAYALQHRGPDNGQSEAFEWLAGICVNHQLIAMNTEALQPTKVKLAIAHSMNDVHH